MKRILLPLCFLAAACLFSCQGEKRGCTDINSPNYDPNAEVSDGNCIYPPNEKKVVLIFFNDTENNACGTFAYPLFNQTISGHSGTVVPILACSKLTDTLFSGAAVNLASTYDIAGFPDIAAGTESGLLTQSSIDAAVTTAAGMTASGNVNADYSIVGDSLMEIEIFGKFFALDTGEFYAVSYILEDDVPVPQEGISTPGFRHDHVLRASTGTSALGDMMASGVVTGQTSFSQSYTLQLHHSWNPSNLKVISVLWKKVGSEFRFVNVHQ